MKASTSICLLLTISSALIVATAGAQDPGLGAADPSTAPVASPRRGDPVPLNTQTAAYRSLAEVEANYRHYQAEIRRLQTLAREAGDEKRFNALHELQQTLEARYNQQLQEVRGRLGEDEFEKNRAMMDRAVERRRHAGRDRDPGRADKPIDGRRPSDPTIAADTNHDGIVDEAERRRAWDQRGANTDDPRTRPLPEPAADTNHDGVIDKAEREAWSQRGRGTADQKRPDDQRRREAQPQRPPADRKPAERTDRDRKAKPQPPPTRPSNPPPPPRNPPPKRDPAGKPNRGAGLPSTEVVR